MLSDKVRKVRGAALDSIKEIEKHPELITILQDAAEQGAYNVLDLLAKLANMEKDEDLTEALTLR
jgi:hypothetical protein